MHSSYADTLNFPYPVPSKAICGLVRYMTVADRRDFIEAALELIAQKKKRALAAHVANRYRYIVDLLGTEHLLVCRLVEVR
jgi:hypothetical protein